jgi:hypothetical protein
MSLTKDDASDLRSHIERVKSTLQQRDQANRLYEEAARQLEQFIYQQEHPPKT